ncbi:MAG: GntR family transcriptional regulator [Eubacterium sp.]|nr:GntR family transcriptional regulator [Eubacterium sp.]MBR3277258.1 GntR family transcriptional regulator [Eubacterium sp.]
MIFIDYKDSRPIYEQITEKYKLLILKGVLKADEQLPSVRSLAMELSANPNTVQKAYTELERQGFIYSVKGRGNFVRGDLPLMEKKKEELRRRLQALFQEAREVGIDPADLLKGGQDD